MIRDTDATGAIDWVYELPIKTPKELYHFVWKAFGVALPRPVHTCKGHVSPWVAFRDAYFAKAPVSVWKASRGLGGKSFLAALLGLTEAVTLKCDVNILGGSGEQAKRVNEYMARFRSRAGEVFIDVPTKSVPDVALFDEGEATQRMIRPGWGNQIQALMASQASVRGPHPARLIGDEVDEVKLEILDSALGQPLRQVVNPNTPAEYTVRPHTVLSSTHQYADGTMTEVLRRAAEKGWAVAEWCYRENLQGPDNPHGWLTPEDVEQKKAEVTTAMWNTEIELQEPNPKDRAIVTDAVDKMFDKRLGFYRPVMGEYIEHEPPVEGGRYSTGCDWAKQNDLTVITTLRYDCKPRRVVAFEYINRQEWPIMVARFEKRLARYADDSNRKWTGRGQHDATGIGNVIADYLHRPARGILMVGRERSALLTDYIAAIENGEIVSPYIHLAYTEHKMASVNDVFGSGHLPDCISSGALAELGAGHGGWTRGSA